jgi:hypothetical protein
MFIFGKKILDPFGVQFNAGWNVGIASGKKEFDDHRVFYRGQNVPGPLRKRIYAILSSIPSYICVGDKDIYKDENHQ